MSKIFNHYRKLLEDGGREEKKSGGFESFESRDSDGFESIRGDDFEDINSAPDFSNSGIKERVDSTRAKLKQIIKEFLNNDPKLHEIAEEILADSDYSLRVLGAEDEDELAKNRERVLGGLETIVRTDGSRPSFIVQNDEVNQASSPVGKWSNYIYSSEGFLKEALSCVGRIDVPWLSAGFAGTGFLVHENLILTNRHVLQEIAEESEEEGWSLYDEITIDFGHEFRSRDSVNRRKLKKVVFCGAEPIILEKEVDHRKLDLALIELEPATAANKPRTVLSVDKAPDWADSGTPIYTVGYPGRPAIGSYVPTLLEQLFQSTYGYKRLAPGEIMKSQQNTGVWTATHDATTLGGNSGSVILIAGREYAAAGLHYGGRFKEPRENWGHILGKVMNSQNSGKTLDYWLNYYGVNLIDRV